jgi:hypothetical protein
MKGELLPIAFLLMGSVSQTPAQRRPVDYVNPLIGTAPITDKLSRPKSSSPDHVRGQATLRIV